MFDECAGNFTHKRLRSVIWLIVVIAFFAIIRWYYVSHIDRGNTKALPPVENAAAEMPQTPSAK